MGISEEQMHCFTVRVNRTAPPGSHPGTENRDRADYRDTPCVLVLPESYDPAGEPCPIILFAHGYGGYVTENSWRELEKGEGNLAAYFVSHGFAVFDVDNTTGSRTGKTDLGCPQLLESYRKAWDHIRRRFNVQDRYLIYSVSFGTFTAMNLMVHEPAYVKAACMTGCRFSVKTVFDRGTYNEQIARCFGFDDPSGETWEEDKLAGFDPYEQITLMTGFDPVWGWTKPRWTGKEILPLQLPPVKAMVSTGDQRELKEALRALRALRNAGNELHLRIVEGLNHSEICGCSVGELREEVRMWFERFI